MLLEATARGEHSAFRDLYDATSSKLFGVVLRIVRDRALAEDVLQETYLKVWQKADVFSPAAGAPLTWLCTIARNRAIDRVRASDYTRRTTGLDGSNDVFATLADPAQTDPVMLETLRLCLSRLESEARECVVLAYCSGFSREELAERFARPVGTIKTVLHRSLKLLFGCLENG
ncbi:RNA polymerase, sigma subunit, ECF family [Faunimonas pinastri]|uniref:RNA polymerase sigma factor n=1 Tax=Faunimonas pinastri TaxID=1855383 RepID=A0A1H9MH64_9HYPH|nr:sigma-70 family RNA polymerase sigma factor [Faunimonas pinastri]SER22513.1 RNA polymerase, sigma subunit, ECF family [Faunimonas pinastri]